AYCPNIFVAQPGAYIGSGNPLGVPNTEMTDPGVLQNTSQRHTCSAKSKDLECRTITLRLELVFVVGSETAKSTTFENGCDATQSSQTATMILIGGGDIVVSKRSLYLLEC